MHPGVNEQRRIGKMSLKSDSKLETLSRHLCELPINNSAELLIAVIAIGSETSSRSCESYER